MISKKVETKLLVSCLYRLGLIVNVDPVVKAPLQQLNQMLATTSASHLHGRGTSPKSGNRFAVEPLDKCDWGYPALS